MSNSKLVFSVAFAFVDGDVSPNIGTKNRTATYMRSLCVSLASVRKFYPQTPIRVFTNVPVPSEFKSILDNLGVENRIAPFNHIAPAGMLDRFQSSLYTLDVISNLEHEFCHALLDPDMVMVRELPAEISQTEKVMALPIGYDLDADCNGLSPREQITWHEAHGVLQPQGKHYGGEFYVVPGNKLTALTKHLEDAWQHSLHDYSAAKSYGHTEEHLMNYAFNYVEVADASEVVARIWTTFNFRRIPPNYQRLNLWHLPAEKSDGFDRLYKLIGRKESWFWKSSPDEFRTRMAKAMSLSQSDLSFRIAKLLRKMRAKFPI
jgi:hypothetical protein